MDTPLWMKIVVGGIAVFVVYMAVIQPTMNCYERNGTPIRGLFMIECIEKVKS